MEVGDRIDEATKKLSKLVSSSEKDKATLQQTMVELKEGMANDKFLYQ